MQNLDILGLESDYFFSILLKISGEGISNSIGFILIIIYPKLVLG